jgi:hypothetical protein
MNLSPKEAAEALNRTLSAYRTKNTSNAIKKLFKALDEKK